MKVFCCFARPVSVIVAAGMFALSLHLPAASAAMIGTEAVVEVSGSHRIAA